MGEEGEEEEEERVIGFLSRAPLRDGGEIN